MTSSSDFPWHPCDILLPFSLGSLAYPIQDSTSLEDIKALTRGIFDSDMTCNDNIEEASETTTPSIWECQKEYNHIVKLRQKINRNMALCFSGGNASETIANELYEIYCEYHASLNSCEKHHLGLQWDSGGWLMPKDDEDETVETEYMKTNITKERRFVLYNLGCLTVLKHIEEVRSLAEEQDWPAQTKLFSTAVAYFDHASLSEEKLKICQAMQQRALFEAASKKSRQNHILLSKLAMATYQSYPWVDNYFEIVAEYHDGKRLRKKKQDAAAYARFLSCSNYIQAKQNSHSQIYSNTELFADIREQISLLSDSLESNTSCTTDSLPKICGKSCIQKNNNKSLPVICTKEPDFFFSCILPSELKDLHNNVKSELCSWLEDWCCNEIQSADEVAENFMVEEDQNSSKIHLSPPNLVDEQFGMYEEDELKFRKTLQNEILALVEHAQLCSEEMNLLDDELKKEKERVKQLHPVNTFVEEMVISRNIMSLERDLHGTRNFLEKARDGNNVLLQLLHADDENNTKDSGNNDKNNLSLLKDLYNLLQSRQVLLSSLKKQVENFSLIPEFQEIYLHKCYEESSMPIEQRSNHRDNLWLKPYKQIAFEYKEKVIGIKTTNFDRNYNDNIKGNQDFTSCWADKLRQNLKSQSQILESILNERSTSPPHSCANKNRQTNIPEELGQGRECYQIIVEKLDQLRTQISDLSIQITKMQYDFKEQKESKAIRERQEKEDEELAFTVANQQIKVNNNHSPKLPSSAQEDLAAILTVIRDNPKTESSHHSHVDKNFIEDTSSQFHASFPDFSHDSHLTSSGCGLDGHSYSENMARKMPALHMIPQDFFKPPPRSMTSETSFRSAVSDDPQNLRHEALINQSSRRHSLDSSFQYIPNNPMNIREGERDLRRRSISDNTSNDIPTQDFYSSALMDTQRQNDTHSRREYARPGIYQVNYYETPQTEVNDGLLATLVGLQIDAERAYAALQRHDNNLEAALDELLLE